MLDLGVGEHAAITDDDRPVDREPVRHCGRAGRHGGRVAGVARVHLDRDRPPVRGADQPVVDLPASALAVPRVPQRGQWTAAALDVAGGQVIQHIPVGGQVALGQRALDPVLALEQPVHRSKQLSLLAERVMQKLPLLNRLAPHLHDFHASSNELLAARPLLVGTVISFLSWGLECLAVYLCAVGLSADVSFLLVVFVFATSSLIGVLSMLPGGIGAVEAGLAVQFRVLAGLSDGLAGALTLVIRLATLWFATLVGIVGLFAVRALLGNASITPDP